MNIAITGGTGFLGRWIVNQLLRDGHDVRVLSRSKNTNTSHLTYFLGDISDTEFNPAPFIEGVDVLINCAGVISDEALMKKTHVDGTQRLLDVFDSDDRKHWIQISSTGAYGQFRGERIVEGTNLKPYGEYEVTKYQADQLVSSKFENNSGTYTILRPSVIIGEEMPNNSLRELIRIVRRGFFVFIGNPVLANYNAIHVSDVASAIGVIIKARHFENETYILSQNVTLKEWITWIGEFNQRSSRILRIPYSLAKLAVFLFGRFSFFPLTGNRLRALTDRSIFDGSKITRSLKFEYKISLKQALFRFLEEDSKL